MKALRLVLPSLALGGAALLLQPGNETLGFTTIGGSLGVGQRDVRVFNNFADGAANNNTTPGSQYPSWDGAELALWKGAVEWSSQSYGDGSGDPTQANLGDGGANFDPFWAGNATGVGNSNNNIVSAITSCGGGTLAFTETPISDGWRIRFCDNWTWADGPGGIGFSQFDMQGVMAHEYGHALGLGHTFNGPTMQPSVSAGNTSIRSIEADDIAGVQFIYGVRASDKPRIEATVPNGNGTITIHGANFDAVGNEVWFTSASATATGADPRVRVTGAVSTFSGTQITVNIPAGAGPGNVIVKRGGNAHSDLSNAFPTDLVNPFGTIPGPPLALTGVTPSQIPALIPGTAQTVTLTGTGLNSVTAMMFFIPPFDIPIDPANYTIVDDNTITLDMPQAIQLGPIPLTVTDGTDFASISVEMVPVSSPQHEVGSGDPFNIVDVTNGLEVDVAAGVGNQVWLYASMSIIPSSVPAVSLDIGNNFTDLVFLGAVTVDSAGYTTLFFNSSQLPNPPAGGLTFFSQGFEVPIGSPIVFPLETTNVQSVTFVP